MTDRQDEPTDDPDGATGESIDLVAAALRTDATDVDTLVRVLGNSLGDMLPAGMVDVQRSRTLADRLARRSGEPVSVAVTTPEVRLSLTSPHRGGGSVEAEVQRIVRGVVIGRQVVSVDEWVRALAAVITAVAARNAIARDALSRLLGA
jgi:hypothetical protein